MGRHKRWVSRRLGLVTALSPELVEDLKLGLLHPGIARRLLVLPRGNQVDVATAARAGKLGVRQTERLVRLYRTAADDARRQWIVEHPAEAVGKATAGEATQPTDPRLSPRARQLRRLMETALAALSRLVELLGEPIASGDRPLLAMDVRTLRTRMEEANCRLGPADSWPSGE